MKKKLKKKSVFMLIAVTAIIIIFSLCIIIKDNPQDSWNSQDLQNPESIIPVYDEKTENSEYIIPEESDNTEIQTSITETESQDIISETVTTAEASEIQNYNSDIVTDTEIQQDTEIISETTCISSETEITSVPDYESDIFDLNNFISDMTLEEKIYQMFIVTPEELVDNVYDCITESDETVRLAVEEKPVGGVIYFSKNLEYAEQTVDMTYNIQQYAKDSGHNIGMFIAVDEEGGDVARISDCLGENNPGAMAYIDDSVSAYDVGLEIARYISRYGFNLDFAPVADVDICSGNELGDRIFSDDAETVSVLSASVVEGLQSTGEVSATLKHFPGLGAEDGNAHYDSYIRIDRTYDELCNEEFKAFQGGIQAGSDFVMVGHQIMLCAGDDLPSDLSYTVVTEWLRNYLGFDGIVITDSHEMNTISTVYGSGEASVMAIQAGVDIVLMPDDLDSAVEAVADAVSDGRISEERINESIYRILSKKQKLGLLNT